jgi:hypothetical protein
MLIRSALVDTIIWAISSHRLKTWHFQGVIANCEIFVSPEQLSHGIPMKCALLFPDDAAYGGPGLSKHVTCPCDMPTRLLRSAKLVKSPCGIFLFFSSLHNVHIAFLFIGVCVGEVSCFFELGLLRLLGIFRWERLFFQD